MLVVPPPELDLLTAPQALSELRQGLTTRPQCLIVDLSKVLFLGAKGIQALLDARTEAEQVGVRLELLGVHGNGLVCRMLTIAGVIGLFDIADHIADPVPRPPDEPRAHSSGVELVFQEQPERRSDAARVTGGYCDEATGHLRWVAVRAADRGAQEEWLVPARHIVSDADRFFVALPTDAVWGGPALSGAPEEIDGAFEERLQRHYVDAVRPTAMLGQAPTSCPAGRGYRISDVTVMADALAQWMTRRRVIDCCSARFGARRIHNRASDAD